MYHKIQKVLVTGGAGCIGMQVCNELLSRGVEVTLFDLPEQIARVEKYLPKGARIHYGSILDCSSLRDAMAGCEGVIHLAAYLGVRRTETNRLRCMEINVNGTQNVLDTAIQNRIKKNRFRLLLGSLRRTVGKSHFRGGDHTGENGVRCQQTGR